MSDDNLFDVYCSNFPSVGTTVVSMDRGGARPIFARPSLRDDYNNIIAIIVMTQKKKNLFCAHTYGVYMEKTYV